MKMTFLFLMLIFLSNNIYALGEKEELNYRRMR